MSNETKEFYALMDKGPWALAKEVLALREQLANSVPRSRIEAMEREVQEAEAKIKSVQESARIEIDGLLKQINKGEVK